MTAPMELTLTAGNGATLSITRVVRAGDGTVASYDATLRFTGGSATTTVHEFRSGLTGYFRDLANSWSGFDGVKRFSSLESDLTIDARHDGWGTFDLDVRLRHTLPDWTLSAVLDFGTGSELGAIADEIDVVLG